MGLSLEQISKATGLSLEDVESISPKKITNFHIIFEPRNMAQSVKKAHFSTPIHIAVDTSRENLSITPCNYSEISEPE
jgi:hypothetical protein